MGEGVLEGIGVIVLVGVRVGVVGVVSDVDVIVEVGLGVIDPMPAITGP